MPFIKENALRNAKLASDVISNEGSYGICIGSLKRYCLDPRGVTFYSNKDPYIASRW